MLNEFKTFIMRGNVIDLAVGIIIGAAFTAIVGSLVSDILMPVLGIFLQGLDFSNVFIALDGKSYATLLAAQEAGVATINIGLFLNAVINFLIVAFVIFVIVRAVNNLNKPKIVEEEAPAEPDPAQVLQERLIATLDKLNDTLSKKA